MITALLNAIQYIENHLNRPICICELSNEIGYSQFYFSRVFSETTRISLYNYIMRRKVSYAYDLILNENIKIIDAALECGFNSHETFIRAFKRHFNITPSEVRTLNIKKPLRKQEALSKEYIQFLMHLSIEKPAYSSLQTYFIGEPANQMSGCNNYLTVFHPDTLISKAYMMQGSLSSSQPVLSYPLNLHALVSFNSSEKHFCERFLFEQIENWDVLIQHYVLMQADLHSITFYTHHP